MSKGFYEGLRGKHDEVLLTWDDFERDVQGDLFMRIESFVKAGCPGVYAIPRGGLILAVCASNHFNIPMLHAPVPGCLIVDDLIDRGYETEAVFRKYVGNVEVKRTILAVWYINESSELLGHCNVFSVRKKKDHQWLTFPWEM